MEKLELWYPLDSIHINQPFGVNGDYYKVNGIDIIGHNGIDFQAAHGTPVRAAHDGEVVYAGMDNKEGCGVVIRTLTPCLYQDAANQSIPAFMKSIYWHLIKDIPVRLGQKVTTGDIIGYADSTGLSTGDHLHFGLKPQAKGESNDSFYNIEQKNGYAGAIDPAPYFTGFYAKDQVKVLSLYQKTISLLAQYLLSLKK